MPDQSRLTEILSRMQSDYIPEHQAAADDFMSEEFPTEILASLIKANPQPNMVSMFFYISGKRNDAETLAAWEYLQYRFESEPQKFNAGDSYNPHFLDNDYRYLLFAARKYLISLAKFSIFIVHLKKVQSQVKSKSQSENSSDVLYHQWLINFFLVYPPSGVKLGELIATIAIDESLASLVGFDEQAFGRLTAQLACRNAGKDAHAKKGSISVDEIQNAFKEMRDMIMNFSFDNYIANAQKVSRERNSGKFLHGRPYFSDVPCPYYTAVDRLIDVEKDTYFVWSIRNFLNECEDVSIRLDMLNRIEKILALRSKRSKRAYEEAIISTNLYFYFEQDAYNIEYTHDFWRNMSYVSPNTTKLYVHRLLPYLVEDAFFDIGSKQEARAYMALEVLLAAKSIEAYTFLRHLILNKDFNKLAPPASNYWEFELRQFYAALWKGNAIERPVVDIGYDWEYLCQRIAKTYYKDARANYEGICLSNNTVPDIVVGAICQNEYGKIAHVSKIIECKKSLYFVEFGTVLNNETTYKYFDFCDTLEFWILEEKDERFLESRINQFPKLKCVFACDLLDAPWLSKEFKDEIYWLMEEAKRQDSNPSRNIESIGELCYAIDHLIEFPPPDIPVCHTRVQKKKTDPIQKVSTTVIRQYAMDGTFVKEFESSSHAALETGLRVDTITNATSGRRNSAGGFLWKKCLTNSPIENITPPNTALDLDGKVILQVDQYGEVVATFNTIGQATKSSGISRRSISDALKGIQKTAGGFSWLLVNAETEI